MRLLTLDTHFPAAPLEGLLILHRLFMLVGTPTKHTPPLGTPLGDVRQSPPRLQPQTLSLPHPSQQ